MGSPAEAIRFVPLEIELSIVETVALEVVSFNGDIIADERRYMTPFMDGVLLDLRTSTPAELADDNPVRGMRRAAGGAAAHRILRQTPGGEQALFEVAVRSRTAQEYVVASFTHPRVLAGDIARLYTPDNIPGSPAIHQFLSGTLNPSKDRGHGCTSPEAVFGAQIVLSLPAAVATEAGVQIWERAAPPQRLRTRPRRARASSMPRTF